MHGGMALLRSVNDQFTGDNHQSTDSGHPSFNATNVSISRANTTLQNDRTTNGKSESRLWSMDIQLRDPLEITLHPRDRKKQEREKNSDSRRTNRFLRTGQQIIKLAEYNAGKTRQVCQVIGCRNEDIVDSNRIKILPESRRRAARHQMLRADHLDTMLLMRTRSGSITHLLQIG